MVASMTNDPKDRHVLAAAVRCAAHAIVTANVRHFPPRSVKPYNLDVLTPDEFLMQQLRLNEQLIREKIAAQAVARGVRIEELLNRLAKWAPAAVRLLTGTP